MDRGADGEVIIEAYLDTKELEKQLRNLKGRLNTLARENDKLLAQKAGQESADRSAFLLYYYRRYAGFSRQK